jgi:phage gpG-like protein
MMTFDASQAIGYIDGMLARLLNMQPLMAEIGAQQASKIMLRIMAEKDDPDGHPWAAWMPATRDERARKGNVGQGLLWDKGTLLHSINVRASSLGVEIGSDSPYARFLNEGTRRMAARPIVGWSAADVAGVENQVVRYLEGINA